jgi:hypothetical protein
MIFCWLHILWAADIFKATEVFTLPNGGNFCLIGIAGKQNNYILLEYFQPLQGTPLKLKVLLGGNQNSPVSSAL